VLDAVSAQPAAQNNRPAPAPAPQQPSTEVTLSRDARERTAQNTTAQQAPAAENVSNNPVRPANETQSSREESGENTAVQARERESRQQQANVAVKAQENAATYTARIAAQSYVSVSNF
jgi:hypothetical protein